MKSDGPLGRPFGWGLYTLQTTGYLWYLRIMLAFVAIWGAVIGRRGL